MDGRGHKRWLRGLLGLLACAVLWLTPRAQADALRVLLVAPGQPELAARVRGQTRDLGIALESVEQNVPLSAERAAALGLAQGAQIVVWAEARSSAGVTLHVLDLASGERRVREVATPPNETLASSTTAEMAALVVRSELSALLVERAAAETAPPPPAETAPEHPPPPPSPQKPAPGPAPAPDLERVAPAPWLLGLSYRPARPVKAVWTHAFALTVRRDLAGFALGLSVGAALPAKISRAQAQLTFTRVQLRLEALKQWTLLAPLRVGIGVAANLMLDHRTTESARAPLGATGAATPASGAFGLFAELQWRFARHLGAFVAGGADAVPWRTQFVVETSGQRTRIARFSWIDPWLMVGVFTRLGR